MPGGTYITSKIAVIGTGTIGHLVGGFLSKSGHDVTVVSQFRRSATDIFKEKGITIVFGANIFSTPVKATFWADLTEDDKFDIIMITGSADFTTDAIRKMMPHATYGTYWSSFQNGIPEDTIIPKVGKENVIPVVCFTGGRNPEIGRVVTHKGYFIIGEMSGEITSRLLDLKHILSCANKVEITTDIISARWDKLSNFVPEPARRVSGLENYDDSNLQRCIARCAIEFYTLVQTCGGKPKGVLNTSFADWVKMIKGRNSAIEAKFLESVKHVRGPTRAQLGDMAWIINPFELAGDLIPSDRLPMEGHNTFGYVVKKAKEIGISTPTFKYLYPLVFDVVLRRIKPNPKYLEMAIAATDKYYI